MGFFVDWASMKIFFTDFSPRSKGGSLVVGQKASFLPSPSLLTPCKAKTCQWQEGLVVDPRKRGRRIYSCFNCACWTTMSQGRDIDDLVRASSSLGAAAANLSSRKCFFFFFSRRLKSMRALDEKHTKKTRRALILPKANVTKGRSIEIIKQSTHSPKTYCLSNILLLKQHVFGECVDLLDDYDFPARTITESMKMLCRFFLQDFRHAQEKELLTLRSSQL